jgi:hypothetical protein
MGELGDSVYQHKAPIEILQLSADPREKLRLIERSPFPDLQIIANKIINRYARASGSNLPFVQPDPRT